MIVYFYILPLGIYISGADDILKLDYVRRSCARSPKISKAAGLQAAEESGFITYPYTMERVS